MLESQADDLCTEGRVEEAINLLVKAFNVYSHSRSLAQALYLSRKTSRSTMEIPQTRIESVCAKIKRLES
jgi:hypothetical protein